MAAKKGDNKPAAAGKGNNNAPKKASVKPKAAKSAVPAKAAAQPTQAEAVSKPVEVRKKGAPVREM